MDEYDGVNVNMTVKDFYCLLFGEFDTYKFEWYFGELLSGKDAHRQKLERRTAAYMAHIYLSEVLKEQDEPSIEQAFALKDIYECSACIRHIAQVYLKGIMDHKDFYFGVRRLVDEPEAVKITRRIKDRSKRFNFL